MFAEYPLQRPPVHPKTACRLRHIAPALLIDTLNMFPTHAVRAHRVLGRSRHAVAGMAKGGRDGIGISRLRTQSMPSDTDPASVTSNPRVSIARRSRLRSGASSSSISNELSVTTTSPYAVSSGFPAHLAKAGFLLRRPRPFCSHIILSHQGSQSRCWQ